MSLLDWLFGRKTKFESELVREPEVDELADYVDEIANREPTLGESLLRIQRNRRWNDRELEALNERADRENSAVKELPYMFGAPKETLLEPKPLLNFLSKGPPVITEVDRTSDEEAIDKLIKEHDGEILKGTFTIEEVYNILKAFEVYLVNYYEGTPHEKTTHKTKPQRKAASRARSAGRKTNSKGKARKGASKQRSAHQKNG